MTAALARRSERDTERTVITADGVRLAVRDHNPSCPEATVVLLHGLCLNQASWSPQVRYLTHRWGSRVRILTYDHRGHGKSCRAPMSTYHVEQLAEDLATVLAAAEVSTPLTLVGHSMGGMATLAYLARPPTQRPVDPTGLILVATAAGRLSERGLGRLLATPLPRALDHLVACAPEPILHTLAGPVCAAVSRYAHCGENERATLATLVAAAIASTPPSTSVGYLRGLRRYDAYSALKTITAQTVVVSGDADMLTPAAHAHDLAAGIADCQHLRLPDAGHMLPTKACRAVNDALGRVLHLNDTQPISA
jgi:pimeloyl-ACP methyl ester carboxylesterase